MSFSRVQRARLAKLIGDERVEELEQNLERTEKALLEAGIAFKDDGSLIAAPLGGATTFAEADAYLETQAAAGEVLDLTDRFRLVIANIFADPELEVEAKPPLLRQAASDFEERLGKLGEKELAVLERRIPASKTGTPGPSPAAAYVADLLSMLQAGPAVGEKTEPATGPAAYIQDLAERGAVQG